MGKIQILTREQKVILDQVKKNKFLCSNFYFTGGTALSAFYLQHRYSEDLDFFSQEDLSWETIFSFVEKWSKDCHFKIESSRFVEVAYMFNLVFENKTHLKVDFAQYPYKQVGKSNLLLDGCIIVDSLTDIAANKLLTISQRDEVKDFVDLYFLLKKFSLWDLINAVKTKFRMEIEPLLLGADFLKVEDFDYLPRMIKPLTIQDLKIFYRKLAKELGKKSVE